MTKLGEKSQKRTEKTTITFPDMAIEDVKRFYLRYQEQFKLLGIDSFTNWVQMAMDMAMNNPDLFAKHVQSMRTAQWKQAKFDASKDTSRSSTS